MACNKVENMHCMYEMFVLGSRPQESAVCFRSVLQCDLVCLFDFKLN
jgi:hypothetical protein